MQSRTFCYIDDNIDACVNAFDADQLVNDVVNIGGNTEITMIDLAKKVIALTKSKSKIIFLPALEEGDMQRRFPDTTKMMSLLKRKPISLDEGIKKILENPQFIIR
jgi:UDP-glucose 4-epimerase